MDFILKPFSDIDIVKARLSKCIELSEDRDLIRYTECDKMTGLLNKDYFFRYVNRLDHLYKDDVLDAVVCDVNLFHSINKQYGRQFCDQVLKSIGNSIKKLARKTGGIGCRKEGDTFLLYCLHQDDYEDLLRGFVSEISTDQRIADRISLRFGVFADARQEPNIEERFARAEIAAERTKDDVHRICGFYS
jgi:diguanylate cyclase (GGDEF)-like protein